MESALTPLLEKTTAFPAEPGVYLMKDAKAHIIYVGKAKSLRSRVRQYFTDHDSRYQVRFLMARVRDIDFIQTRTEREALLLENSLIKKHKPRYNVFLKDDKTYLGLKLTLKDDFPRLFETRRIKKDGSAYYGPFTSAEKLREVKEFIDHYFLLRTCSDHEFNNRTRPCLEYQIKRCSAPCVDLVNRSEYARQIESVRFFLEGRNRDLQRTVRERMHDESRKLNYEESARLRDLLNNMEMILEKQNVTRLSFDFLDVIAIKRIEDKVGIAVLMVRDAELIDSKYFISAAMEEDEELLQNFITQYYSEDAFIPREIVVPLDFKGKEILADVLQERAKTKVTIRLPFKGEKRNLLELALQNLISHFSKAKEKAMNREQVLASLMEKLNLTRIPTRIECYDNSHIAGTNAVSSLVCFVGGEADKKSYRRFKIQTEDSQNDFAMMYEVLQRRFSRDVLSGNEDAWQHPDLILIDGGKGQLTQALKALTDLNLTGIDVIAIAKGKGEGARAKGLWDGKKEEEIFLPHRKNPVIFRRGSPEIQLLQRIRDEAHRFAITYHRKLREKSLTHSWLDDISGIGAKRKNALLKFFGSPQAVREASRDELLKVPGITNEIAKKILLTQLERL